MDDTTYKKRSFSSAKIEEQIHSLDREVTTRGGSVELIELHPEVFKVLAAGLENKMRYAPPSSSFNTKGEMQWQGVMGRFLVKPKQHLHLTQMAVYDSPNGLQIHMVLEGGGEMEIMEYTPSPIEMPKDEFVEALKQL